MLENLGENIFSIYNQNGEDTRKVVKLLGIKMKFKNLKAEMALQAETINKNTVNLLYHCILKHAQEEELFCLRAKDILFILHKNAGLLDYNFFKDYMIPFGYGGNVFELTELDKSSILYNEHINRVKNGEFCWKYAERKSCISHAFISKDINDGEIYIHSSSVNEAGKPTKISGATHCTELPKRKYIKGLTAGEYLKNKTEKEKFVIVDKLVEYLFNTFKDPDNPDKISGKLFDCHLYNFILTPGGKFNFIDFDLTYDKPLDKSYCIYFMLYKYDIKLYKKILKKYALKDRHSYYEKHFLLQKQPLSDEMKKYKSSKEHKKLYQKYFTDAGLMSDIIINP